MGYLENIETDSSIFWQIEHNGSWHWEISDEEGHLYLQLSGPSEIESKHNEDINAQIPWVEIDKDLSSFEMAVQYWIQGRRSGPFFSTGIRYGNATGLDTVFEAGIRMHILKGFGLVASIKTGIIDNIRSKSFNSNILRLGIDYSF